MDQVYEPLKEFSPEYQFFLDRSTVLFGESSTGKSVIICDILHSLKSHIDLAVVFSPTDMQNGVYSAIIPKPLIHYKVTPLTVTTIWERQKKIAATYKKASNPEIIERLLRRIPNYSKFSTIRGEIKEKKKQSVGDVRENMGSDEAKKVEAEYDRLDALWAKKLISHYASTLSKMNLSEEEKFTLKYIDLNPRIVIVFDDCTDQLKKINKCPAIQELFYQGRHNYVTFIIGCHHDKTLDPELKKNIFVSVYTAKETASAYIERTSTSFDKATKARWHTAIGEAFSPTEKYQKLVWVRDDKKFFKWTAAVRRDFEFCSKTVWDFCTAIESTETRIDNAFNRDFD